MPNLNIAKSKVKAIKWHSKQRITKFKDLRYEIELILGRQKYNVFLQEETNLILLIVWLWLQTSECPQKEIDRNQLTLLVTIINKRVD